MKHFSRYTLLIVLITSFAWLPKFSSALGDPGDDPDTPIDGGVTLLVAAGVGYGIKKYRDDKKKKRDKAIF